MNSKPIVSVIIPTFNRAKTLKRSVRSVLDQSFRDLEVIIVDDCSNDDTIEIVRKIEEYDNRVRFYRLNKNSGACIARNFGIQKARGQYIAFQDSDDEWDKDKILFQLNFMKKNKAKISFCQFKRISNGNVTIFPNVNNGKIPRNEILRESIVSTQTLMIERCCLKTIIFDNKMPRMQDYDLCIRLSKYYDFYFIKKPLVNIYVQNDSISRNWNKLYDALCLIKKKYPDLVKKNKEMNYFLTKNIAISKERLLKNSLNERILCFRLYPNTLNMVYIFKSCILSLYRKVSHAF